MPITINTNVASLKTQRRLADGTSALSESFQRLSSGLRINRASDDASGLAIASGLNTDTRVFTQGVRNLNDGVSLLNIAEGAVTNSPTSSFEFKSLLNKAAMELLA